MLKTPLISQFLPSSKVCAVLLTACLWCGTVEAQEAARSPVLTIDQDRLFSETRLGAKALEDFESEAQKLASENKTIEADLTAEEKALTEERAGLTPEQFRDKADAFDIRVQELRAAQDEKARQLTELRDEARATFFQEVAVIISDIVREKGALVVIDRRDVFLSADRIDITEEAIARVNDAEGRAPD